jgi:hypothetical protein
MKAPLKGCAIFFGSIAAGLAIGLPITAILWAVTGSEKIGATVGTGVWLISAFVIQAYASIWIVSLGGFNENEIPHSKKHRFQRGLRMAEASYAATFSSISGMMAHAAGAPWYLIIPVAIALAILGGFVGFDIKRRYKRIGLL